MKPINRSELFAEFMEYGKLQSVKVIDCHTHMSGIGEAKFAELKDRITVDNEGDMTNEDSGGR